MVKRAKKADGKAKDCPPGLVKIARHKKIAIDVDLREKMMSKRPKRNVLSARRPLTSWLTMPGNSRRIKTRLSPTTVDPEHCLRLRRTQFKKSPRPPPVVLLEQRLPNGPDLSTLPPVTAAWDPSRPRMTSRSSKRA